MPIWNPWHGCHKISAGCQNCYVYRRDESVGRDASVVTRTADFDLPRRRGREQCVRYGVAFHFKQTGARFIKDGRLYRIERRLQEAQAARAGIDYTP